MTEPLAEVRLSCGRWFLQVAGFALAMQGDRCREGKLPEEVYPPVPAEELAHAKIWGRPAAALPPDIVRFFRGTNWTKEMLEYVAAAINRKVSDA